MAPKAQKRANNPVKDEDSGEPSEGSSFPIVGVGASAGGLAAFTELLTHLPLDTGMGFVLVQHLDPEHESALTQLLARATKMPVREITNNQRVEANCVYVIPPNTNLGIARGVLKLQPRPETRTPHRSIDFFFESLAEDQRQRAIGVILSGTATDGTLGLEAIKAEGGITFAQDDSARYDSMPRSAVAAGCVDFVLSPENIAKELARIATHPYVAGQPPGSLTPAEDDRADATAHADDDMPLPSGGRGTRRTSAQQARADAERGRGGERASAQGAENGFEKILLLLRNHSGVDFSLYKSATLQRRITRRMVLNEDTLESYAHFLRGNAKELDALYSDALLSVTSFFRNPEAFDVLKRTVFPTLLQRLGNESFRAWVLGCSTGQEAYSIAMAFVEAAENTPRMPKLQVFATDLNDALLEKARQGLYAKGLAEDLSPERLRRFFVEEEGGYRVVKSLRERVVFARQDLISDPPFSRTDLISCRNLLIYLEPSVQKKALRTFHYALKPEGLLFLGASESIGGFTDLFEPMDKKHKIYSRKAATTPALHVPGKRGDEPAPGQRPLASLPMGPGEAPEGFRAELDAQREADRITVNQIAPPGVLIDAELQIVQFRGPTGAYLEPPAGKVSFDVLKMARQGLMLPLHAAINQAKKENKAVRRENVRVEQNGKTRTVNLEVIPLKNLRERCFLIVFEEAGQVGNAADTAPLPTPRPARKESRHVADLERESSEVRDYLQSIQEQYEAANEEIQASSEELQSANEELQSINEELETSKEELESANEELTTVNEEMANRNAELNRLNSDLINLQTSTKLAVVLVGRDLSIRRFSPQAEKQFALLATDVGRPISHIRHNLVFADGAKSPSDLEGLSAEVIASAREQEHEVCDKAGRWYSLRVRPYMTLDNKVDGAVLVLVDIDALKCAEQAVAAARDYAENTVETVREPLLVLDNELRVEGANRSFYRAFRVAPSDTICWFIYDLGNRQWDIPRLRELLGEVLAESTSIDDFQVEHDFEQLGRRTMLLNARRVHDPQRKGERILLAIEDITERRRAEEAVRESRFREMIDALPAAIYATDAKGRLTHFNPAAAEVSGRTPELGTDRWCVGWKLYRPDGTPLPHEETSMAIALKEGRDIHGEQIIAERPDGTARWLEPYLTPLRDTEGRVIGRIHMLLDITERKQADHAARESEERYRTLFDSAPMAVFVCDRNAVILQYNARAVELWGREPTCGVEKHCGSTRLWLPDGTLLPHDQSPVLDALRTGVPAHNVEVFIERPDGSRLPVLVNFAAITNARGEVTGAITSFIDITERKRAEEELRQAEKRLRFVMDSMPQKIFTAKPNGDVDYFNPIWTEFTGLTFEHIRDWGWTQFIHPDDVEENVSVWQRSIDTGEPFQFEHRFRRADGEYRWHLSRALPMRDAEGRIVMWIGSNTDVHEQQQTANKLQQLAADLSEADRRKNEFLAMLAHELRNPLAPIRNALQVMRLTGGDGEAVHSAFEMMERQVGQMVRLVDDLLDVSRISRARSSSARNGSSLRRSYTMRSKPAALPWSVQNTTEHHVAAAADVPARRPDEAGASDRQPLEQRLQVHRQGWPHLAHDRARTPPFPPFARGGWGGRRYPSAGHRHRHPTRPASAYLRDIRAGRYFAGAVGKRVRHRPDTREKRGGNARRHGRGLQCRCRSGE